MEKLRSGVLKIALALFVAAFAVPMMGCADESGPATVPDNAQPLDAPQQDNASETEGKVNLPTE